MHDSTARLVTGWLVGALLAPAACYSGSPDAASDDTAATADTGASSSAGPATSDVGETGGADVAGDPTDVPTQADTGSASQPTGGDSSGAGDTGDASDTGDVEQESLPPEIGDPGPQTIEEDVDLDLTIAVSDANDDPLRVWTLGLPPGATWNEAERRLHFRPDFIQGAHAWTVTVVADDGEHRVQREFMIDAVDSIQPPAPEVTKVEEFEQYTRLTLTQKTDSYLDSPGNAGRSFVAYVSVPKSATLDKPGAVRISLHGFNGMPALSGSSSEFRIDPHDSKNTYWWGYSAALTDADPGIKASGDVPDYTQRRVMHLLGWMLATYPEADPTRVSITGGSMGGAGALQIGLWYARHFAHASGSLAQAIPRNHRPGRIAQLQTLWGASDGPLWDLLDLTRVMRESAEAHNQYLFTRHGKDDPTIHFGATTHASPLTGLTLYGALQTLAVGHFSIWDEGAHGPEDPVLGNNWWDKGFSPTHDAVSHVRTDLAFPAFSRSSIDRDPGTGEGNGKKPWDVNAGFSGDVAIAGDTGWNGDIAGTLNRFLRWDATAIVDTLDAFSIPLHVHSGDGEDPPKDGYPTRGDRFNGTLPVVVDVAPRRLQAFQVRPGERIAWAFGTQSGELDVEADGTLRVPGLELGLDWQTLTLARVPD